MLMWMHAGGLSSLDDSITGMAEDYSRSLAEAQEQAESGGGVGRATGGTQAAILDKYRPLFLWEVRNRWT